MVEKVTATDRLGRTASLNYDSFPDTCPICHTGIVPRLVAATLGQSRYGDECLQIVFQCTKAQCEQVFIGIYYLEIDRDRQPSQYFRLSYVTPRTAEQKQFSEVIRELSPNFIEIFNQSVAAETMNLTQIVGCGLRKALEFLVKDFAINRNPDQEEGIRGARLGSCIANLEDTKLQECARRAAWLGNDETHYTRRWTDKDINDLKILIKLTVNWVENTLLTERYIEDMPE